jgi:pyridoxal phosphate enzyme (YggS family)
MENLERFNYIAENYRRVQENINEAMARRRVGSGPVRLLAATKTVQPDAILFAVDHLGLSLIGENRTTELVEKYPALEGRVEQHFIGHLQTNKVKQVVGRVSLIESVDSLRLAQEISRRSEMQGITTDILVEINSGREENKGGVLPEDARAAVREFDALAGIRVRGLMTMAPVCANIEDSRKYFRETYAIFIDIFEKNKHNIIEPILSMGMSSTYGIAIEEGATEVRVGQAIFGRR